jgi:cobalt-zinc-cadmium efflux system protein
MSAHAHQGHSHEDHSGAPAFVPALLITLAYAFIELGAGLWSGSLALTSDAGHMFSDALALGLAAAAAWLARRPPGMKHSYGLARAEVIGASLNGLLMLGIIVVLVVESVHRILEPRAVSAGVVIGIAAIGLVVNAGIAYILSRGHRDLNVRGALVHVLGDLVSSLAALISGAVIYATGWLLIDPILSLVIALLILLTTLRLLRDTLHVLMEGVPAAVDFAEIGSALAGLAGVAAVHDLHVWSIGSRGAALSAHLEIERLEDWPAVLRASQDLLHDRFGITHVTLQPEIAWLPKQATITMWPRRDKSA